LFREIGLLRIIAEENKVMSKIIFELSLVVYLNTFLENRVKYHPIIFVISVPDIKIKIIIRRATIVADPLSE
jgi:hypothetical protein